MFKHLRLKHGNLPICVYTLTTTVQVFTVLSYAQNCHASGAFYVNVYSHSKKSDITMMLLYND